MSSPRLDYRRVAPGAMAALDGVSKYFEICEIEEKLRRLVELRVSQINGCAYCIDLHINQLLELSETRQRIDCLLVWRDTTFYTHREVAALEWAEAVTRIGERHVPDEIYDRALTQLAERELVDLTLIVATMNAWNRIAISFGKMPYKRE